ncbi:MAG: serpin family protein [Ruminococcaceae bacterium]|nr:serpin family protein [Oscillospiraceae bacterium]
MTKKDWDEALNGLDPDLVEEYVANLDACPRKRSTRPYWFAAVAAVLALAIGIGALLNPGKPLVHSDGPGTVMNPGHIQSPNTLQLQYAVAVPKYPAMVQKPNYDDYSGDGNAYSTAFSAWNDSQKQQYNQPDGYADSLTDFFQRSMAEFLQGSDNPTYSPLNVYMAMAMLAETTGGNSRQQILDLFGLDTIEQLREQASHVWNAHYSDDGETTLLMANSVWLDNFYSFHQNTTNLLADQYFASSFHGDLGTGDMNKQLQAWLDANTGGLLKDQAQNIKLDPLCVFVLASTLYFSAGWQEEFSVSKTSDAVFHCADHNLMTPFMNKTFTQYTYYRGENFGAISLGLTGYNKMWLILPDKGHAVEEILESDDYLRMTLDPGSWKNQKQYKINLSLPKFDVVSQCDLIDGMKNLGITDIFNSEISDFTPLTDTPNLYVSQINHAARVAIDEKGCIAAAFTVIATDGTGMPADLKEIDFTLDRPFLFVVSSRDNLPLFAGIVNEP